MSLNTGRLAARAEELERNPQNLAILTPRFATKFTTWKHPSHAEGAYPQNCIVEQTRNEVSEMHFDKIPESFDIAVLGNELQDRGVFLL